MEWTLYPFRMTYAAFVWILKNYICRTERPFKILTWFHLASSLTISFESITALIGTLENCLIFNLVQFPIWKCALSFDVFGKLKYGLSVSIGLEGEEHSIIFLSAHSSDCCGLILPCNCPKCPCVFPLNIPLPPI